VFDRTEMFFAANFFVAKNLVVVVCASILWIKRISTNVRGVLFERRPRLGLVAERSRLGV